MIGLDPNGATPARDPGVPSRARAADEALKALGAEDYPRAIALLHEAIAYAAEEGAPDTRMAELRRLQAAAHLGAGLHAEGRAFARQAVDLAHAAGDALAEARSLYQEALACFQLGDYAAGLAAARSGLVVLQETPENDDIGNLQIILGSILLQQGEWNEALTVFHDALASFRRSRNEWGVARAHGHLAVVYKNLGRLDQAVELSEKAEELAARLGRATAGFALNQGIARYWKGDHGGAEACLVRSLAVSQESGDTIRYVRALVALGRLLTDRGRAGEARPRLECAERLASERQYRRELVLAHQYLGDIDFESGERAEAERRWREAEELAGRVAPGGDLRASIWTRQSLLARLDGDFARAIDLGTRAAVAAESSGVVHDRALALVARAEAAHALSCHAEALSGFAEGLGLLRTSGVRFELARVLHRTGRLLARQGRNASRDEGFRMLDEAAEVFGSLSEAERVAETLLDIVEFRAAGDELDPAQAALRRLRAAVARESARVDPPLAARLAAVEDQLSRALGESAASQDNPFRRLERGGHLGTRLHESADPEADLLRSFLASTESDRGFLALAPALGSGPLRVVAIHGIARREAEGIARILWLSSPGDEALAAMPGISVSPGWDRRFAGSPLEHRAEVGSSLWVRITREERESALLYSDRLEQEGFRPYGQMDLSLATSLSHLFALSLDNLELRRILRDPARRRGIITQDPKMLQIVEAAARVEGDLEIILLQGETGTGKNHLARAIHAMSRHDRPFNEVRCTDVTESLVEAELFGHERGAFTDARTQRDGLLARTGGGTIFVDEIDKATIKFQSRLLGVLGEGVFRPVGGSYQKLEARIICASAKDLRAEVRAGRFLEELYYRLKKFSFTLPPLRERRGDIPLLTEYFLEMARKAKKRDDLRLSPEALRVVMCYPWPGNVRDLEHEIGRGATFADASGLIGPEAFSDDIQDWRRATNGECAEAQGAGASAPLGAGAAGAGSGASGDDDAPGSRRRPPTIVQAVSALETRMVREALERNHGVKSRAARELGLTRRGLDLKMLRYGLAGPTERDLTPEPAA